MNDIRKPPKIKILEKDVTKSVRSYLKAIGMFHWKVWQGLGSTKGVSDIIALHRGTAIFIEIKTPIGKLSPDQRRFLQDVNNNGGLGVVVRSVSDIMDIIIKTRTGIPFSQIREEYAS